MNIKIMNNMKRYFFLLLFLLSLLPMVAQGQSEVTRRVSASEMGYRGRVEKMQCTEWCRDSEYAFFVTMAEAYNEAGMRTDLSVVENIYQTSYHYEYDDNGQLVYSVETFYEGGKDSVVFHYATNGCLAGYEEYSLSPDPTEGNSVTDVLVACDAQCRVLMCASVWEDTMRYKYDNQGRLTTMTGHGLPEQIKTFHYDNNGRLARVRMGAKHYEETHYRYNEQGDTIEMWHTNWEHVEGDVGDHEVGEHKYYNYTAYDDHGNWTNATVTVKENRWKHTYFIVRTFKYYE